MTLPVSVIMTAYNAAIYIEEAIESVLKQTFPHFEFIIVNDASKDTTKDILEDYAKKDSRIKLIHNEKNLGVGLSSNAGLAIAQGKYIARFDADDVMLPERIERQVKFMEENPEIGMSSCHAYFIDKKGKIIGVQRYKGYEHKEAFLQTLHKQHQIICSHSGFICLREALLRIGGYRNLRVGADADMFTRMAEAGYILVVPDEILLKFRMHGTSIMAKTNYEDMVTRTWIHQSAIWRQTNQPVISLDEYREILKNENWWKKMNRRRIAYAFSYYKVAITAYANRRFGILVLYMAWATLLSPTIIFKKVFTHLSNLMKIS